MAAHVGPPLAVVFPEPGQQADADVGPAHTRSGGPAHQPGILWHAVSRSHVVRFPSSLLSLPSKCAVSWRLWRLRTCADMRSARPSLWTSPSSAQRAASAIKAFTSRTDSLRRSHARSNRRSRHSSPRPAPGCRPTGRVRRPAPAASDAPGRGRATPCPLAVVDEHIELVAALGAHLLPALRMRTQGSAWRGLA